MLDIRRFLERSGAAAAAPAATAPRLLVVIDHRGAKIDRTEERGAVPQQIFPYDPHGLAAHLRADGEENDGKRRPERKDFYEAVAATLARIGSCSSATAPEGAALWRSCWPT